MQTQHSNGRVIDGGRTPFEVADVVSSPELPESRARKGEFANEFDSPSIGDVVTDRTAKRCDRDGCSSVPVVVELAFLRIEE